MSGVSVAEPEITLHLDHEGVTRKAEEGVGRNLQATELQARFLAAQQTAGEEHWKLRAIETRHRLLFDASQEARLAVDGELRVIEANPAAVRALGVRAGSSFIGQLASREREPFLGLLQRVRELGGAPGMVLHFGTDQVSWAIRASLIDGAADGFDYLLHVTPVGVRADAPAARALPLDALMERLPDGFVIASAEGNILQANRAFLDLVQVGAAGAVQGHALSQWMTQPGADAAVLLASVRRHGSVRSFETVLQGQLGVEIIVEVSAAGYAAEGIESFGIALRDVGRREGVLADVVVPCAVADVVAEQVGRAPLSAVVRSAVDAIERSMIHAALERVDGNRTAAAELLGLSRQSLHSKLNRHAAEGGALGQPEPAGR